MKVFECTPWVITLFLLQNPGNCLTTKRRLCVEYKKENYLEKSKHITTAHADTAGKCLASCVRRYPCMAFNYHIINKTCILMRKVNCMAPSSLNNPGYLFVHLQACKSQPVWFSVRPADRGWHWVTTDDPANNTDIINVPDGTTNRYVSRTLYRGYYLPSWWQGDKGAFRAVDPTISKVKCPYGEFLIFLTLLLIFGSRILLGIRCRIVPCQCLNYQMEPPSILLDIALLICKGEHRKYMDPTVTSQNSHILCIMVSWMPHQSIFFVALTFKVQVYLVPIINSKYIMFNKN